MTSVKEFVEVRESIETLASKITVLVERKAMQDSRQYLTQANEQLEVLKSMVDNTVQGIAANRLSRQLTGLGIRVEGLMAKKAVKKTVTAKKRRERSG